VAERALLLEEGFACGCIGGKRGSGGSEQQSVEQ
jgi:hypothetical protein